MKPIEFMDALSDVKENYVMEMLEEKDKTQKTSKVGGFMMNTEVPLRAQGDFGTVKHRAESEKPLGGVLRYITVFASAAACIAGVVGIMHMNQTDDAEIAADSAASAVQEIEEVTETAETAAVTTGTAASAHAVTAVTTKKTTATETAAVTTAGSSTDAAATQKAAESAAVQAEAPAASASQPQSSMTAASTTTETLRDETTVSTTSTKPRSTPAETTVTVPDANRYEYRSYDQPYQLGDVDADREITLLDFMLAAREYFKWEETGVNGCVLDEAALDRADVDRISRETLWNRVTVDRPPIQNNEYYAIRDVAILQKWLGKPEAECRLAALNWYWTDMQQIYAPLFEDDTSEGAQRTECQIVDERIPEEVRDFYSTLFDEELVVYEPGLSWMHSYELRIKDWTDEEFAQKMDELRGILARN